MSFPESLTAPSLADIRASLNLRLATEEAITELPLTKGLEQCLLFAKAHNLPDLAESIKQEIYGYNRQPPNYRYVELSYFDGRGQMVKTLDQYSIYPVATGIVKLERHLKNGLTLMLPKQILVFLTEVSGREVDNGHMSAQIINKLLDSIRQEFILKFASFQDGIEGET
jgi:hypothetical protein